MRRLAAHDEIMPADQHGVSPAGRRVVENQTSRYTPARAGLSMQLL
ncbi:hypothetical protein [Bifidobacterium thermophilum]|nr:hypothetical protein [Bifidobacterium thermophilum]